MATTDQNFTVYAAAQKVVSAYLQAHNNSLVESGDPLVSAIVGLNDLLNAMPEYMPNGIYIPYSANVPMTTFAGGTPMSGPITVKAYAAPDKSPLIKLPAQAIVLADGVNLALSGTQVKVKGVVDGTITTASIGINTNSALMTLFLS